MKKLVISVFIVLVVLGQLSFTYGENDISANSTNNVVNDTGNNTVGILEGKQVRRNIKNKRRYTS